MSTVKVWAIDKIGPIEETRIERTKRTDGLSDREMRDSKHGAALAYAPRFKSIRDEEFGSQEISRPVRRAPARTVSLPAEGKSESVTARQKRAQRIGSNGPKNVTKDLRKAFWAAR